MSGAPRITVLCGGRSSEAEISRVSGASLADALRGAYQVELIELTEHALPAHLEPETTVIFPAMHGEFGEDGQLQSLMEAKGFAYAGSDARASALCMHKIETKAAVAGSGFAIGRDATFSGTMPPSAQELISQLGPSVVIKPVDKGSSVGLYLVEGERELAAILSGLGAGQWMAEERLVGRELTVGLLDCCAMGIVEIVPQGGVYDYQHKYTTGATEYIFPALLEPALGQRIREAAEAVFALCQCRDFARVDFILTEDGRICLLEINTIPGLTPASLLPKSASCLELDFNQLAERMVQPAIARYYSQISMTHG